MRRRPRPKRRRPRPRRRPPPRPRLDPAEVEAEVSTAIEGFFAALGEGRYEDAATYLENGDAHLAEFQSFSELAVGVTAEAKGVELLDPRPRLDTIDILINGEVALPDSSGEAVLVGETWLMSEGSWNCRRRWRQRSDRGGRP